MLYARCPITRSNKQKPAFHGGLLLFRIIDAPGYQHSLSAFSTYNYDLQRIGCIARYATFSSINPRMTSGVSWTVQ